MGDWYGLGWTGVVFEWFSRTPPLPSTAYAVSCSVLTRRNQRSADSFILFIFREVAGKMTITRGSRQKLDKQRYPLFNPCFIILDPPKRVPKIIQKMTPKNDAQIIPNLIIQKMMVNIIPKIVPNMGPKYGQK